MSPKHKYVNISVLEEVLLENEKAFDGKKYLDEIIISMQNNIDSKQPDYALISQKKELEKAQHDRALLDKELSDEMITAYLCNKTTEEEKEMIKDRAGYDPSFLRELCEITSMIISDFEEQVKHARKKKTLKGLVIVLNIFFVALFIKYILDPDALMDTLNRILKAFKDWQAFLNSLNYDK